MEPRWILARRRRQTRWMNVSDHVASSQASVFRRRVGPDVAGVTVPNRACARVGK